MFTFGDDTSSSFDWGSLLSSVVTTAGQVGTAAINANNQVSAYGTAVPAGYTYNAATGQYVNSLGQTYTPASLTSATGSSTLLLLGAAGLLAFLFLKKRKG